MDTLFGYSAKRSLTCVNALLLCVAGQRVFTDGRSVSADDVAYN